MSSIEYRKYYRLVLINKLKPDPYDRLQCKVKKMFKHGQCTAFNGTTYFRETGLVKWAEPLNVHEWGGWQWQLRTEKNILRV
ncbi:hypothetical protein J2Z32_000586 [Paenibacillus turicensis]|uniref:Uncharacterized protein n=1 Tax=Paenibacillus turicensis TaxID=160487 RepID=A0ABS4FN15_9BACL|nr:hypothetical protein [Paenibacillus turicensis]